MLFDNYAPQDSTPYFSNPVNDPRYQALLADQKKNSAISGAWGDVWKIASSFVPFVGGVIGKETGNFFDNVGKKGYAQQFAAMGSRQPQNTTNNTGSNLLSGTGEKSLTGLLSGMFSQNKPTTNFSSFNSFSAPKSDSFQTSEGTDPTLQSAPATDQYQGTPIDVTPSSDNMDWGSIGGDVGGDIGFSDGGGLGANLLGSGKDDIALVDTKTGGDTGVRVQKGEMLVVSKDNLAKIYSALDKKDHKGLFNIMKEQVKQAPKVKDGSKGYADGGEADTDESAYDKAKSYFKNLGDQNLSDVSEPDNVEYTPATTDEIGAPMPQPSQYATIINQGGTYAPASSPTASAGDSLAKYKGLFGNVAGTGFDVARGFAGWNAANKPLPTFQKSPNWVDYINQLKTNSGRGLSANDMAALQRNTGQGYAYDMANVRDLSGGNSGQALGNLGRAAGNYYGAENQIAALNQNAHLQNLQLYGSALPTDMAYDRQIFGDKYNEALWSKQAGSQLANDAIKNIQERGVTNSEFGPGSLSAQIQGYNLNAAKNKNDLTQQLKDYYMNNPDAYAAMFNSSSATPDYKVNADGTVSIGGKMYKAIE